MSGRTSVTARRELLASYAELVITHSRLIRVLAQDPAGRQQREGQGCVAPALRSAAPAADRA
jgi:hypothetical protein